MSSQERLSSPPDSDRNEDLAEALDEVARAEAQAKLARAHALRLTREAAGASSPSPVDSSDDAAAGGETVTATAEGSVGAAQQASTRSARWRRRLLRWPNPRSMAVSAAVVLICASLAVSGYVRWYHHGTVDQRQRSAEFAAAARKGAVTVMSIDAGNAREDFQRIIDDATGSFKNEMLITANDRVESVEQSKLSTKAVVTGVAVESMTEDSAVVLVTAKSEVVASGNDKVPSRYWRMVMTLQRDGGQLKMSKLEFVR